jgi:2-hydroxymuconate-semialdehyde hydrolase
MNVLKWLALALAASLTFLFVVGTVLIRRLEPEERPLAPSGPDTSFLTTRSGRVHVLDVGAGEVILLLHGSGRSVADWQEGLAERLARRHRVVAFDNYGCGLSDREHALQYGNALWKRQAIDVLDALDIGRVVVFGHSAGGVVAACLAADHPDRVRGAVFTGHGIAVDPAQLIPLVPGLGELSMGRTTVFGDVFSERHRRQAEAAYRIRGTRAALLTFIRRQYTIDGLRLLRGTYEDIDVPVLQVHGTRDTSIPIDAARRLAERVTTSRLVAVDGARHDVHIDAPDRLAAEITAFVAQLPP